MRHDPLFLLWVVNCATPEDARRLQQRLHAEISPDTPFVDEVRACPDGFEARSRELHRLGDYFESVRVLLATGQAPSTFGLLFQRRPDAGRFWKDFMARLLQGIRNEAVGVTTTLSYRGDEEPQLAVARP
jgi:hypothetical protein